MLENLDLVLLAMDEIVDGGCAGGVGGGGGGRAAGPGLGPYRGCSSGGDACWGAAACCCAAGKSCCAWQATAESLYRYRTH